MPGIFFPDVNSKVNALQRWDMYRDCLCDMCWHHARCQQAQGRHAYLGQCANDHICESLATHAGAFTTALRDPFDYNATSAVLVRLLTTDLEELLI